MNRPRWFCILPCHAKIVTQSGWSPAMSAGLSWMSADARRCPGGLGTSVNLTVAVSCFGTWMCRPLATVPPMTSTVSATAVMPKARPAASGRSAPCRTTPRTRRPGWPPAPPSAEPRATGRPAMGSGKPRRSTATRATARHTDTETRHGAEQDRPAEKRGQRRPTRRPAPDPRYSGNQLIGAPRIGPDDQRDDAA